MGEWTYEVSSWPEYDYTPPLGAVDLGPHALGKTRPRHPLGFHLPKEKKTMPKPPDYDRMTKEQLADTLRRRLTKQQLRDLVRDYIEGDAAGEQIQ